MTKKDIINDIVGHFTSDMWPIRVEPSRARAIKKYCPYAKVRKAKKGEGITDDRTYWVECDEKDIDKDHLILYYKSGMEEYRDLYWNMIDGVQRVINNG